MNDMNLFQQFIAYFSGKWRLCLCTVCSSLPDLYLWRFIRCNRWYSTRNLDF